MTPLLIFRMITSTTPPTTHKPSKGDWGCAILIIAFIFGVVALVLVKSKSVLEDKEEKNFQIEQLLEKELGKGNYSVALRDHGFYIARDKDGAVKVITYWDDDPGQRARDQVIIPAHK